MKPDFSFLESESRGDYFTKKEYDDTPLAPYEQIKALLPEPVIEAKPEWIRCYWYAVSLAFKNRKTPTPQSGYVSNFVDAAFNDDIFLWDTVFITMFCNLFHPYIPGIRSLDNFYCKQFEDGEIPREMVRETGKDYLPFVNGYGAPLYSYFHKNYVFRGLKKMESIGYDKMFYPDLGRSPLRKPHLTLDNLNHPIAAWAEWVSYLHTGDVKRLKAVFPPLLKYYRALHYHLRHTNSLYVTDWASMDNSPRNKYLGCGVDISCEMVLFARNLLSMIDVLKNADDAPLNAQLLLDELTQDAQTLSNTINRLLWNKEQGFYFDLARDGKQAPVKTIAAYWALLGGVADEAQAASLINWLADEKSFNRKHRVPVLAADEQEFDPNGSYWSGSVWAPTNTMVIYGLEQYGYHTVARDIALNHLAAVCQVFEETGTIWENYPADSITSGNADKKDFVGWSGIGPILYLIQYGIGLKADAPTGRVYWDLDETLLKKGSVGCRQYWFFGKVADFIATAQDGTIHIRISTKDCFDITLRHKKQTVNMKIDGTISFDL